MVERTWFSTGITMQPFCLQATMNAENVSLSSTRGTQAVDTLADFAFAIFARLSPDKAEVSMGRRNTQLEPNLQ